MEWIQCVKMEKSLCDFNEMIITGTEFNHKEIPKLTLVSPNEKMKNKINHTLVNRKSKNIGDRPASDHFLVR